MEQLLLTRLGSSHTARPLSSRIIPLLRTRTRSIATASAIQEHPSPQEPPPYDLPTPHTFPPPPRPSPSPNNVPGNAQPRKFPEAKPFSSFLTDTFHRQHDYLRISITERCNLRCTYCMPEAGVPLSPSADLLTTPEIVYLSELFVSQGVSKIRLTGGEPTIRKDIVPLMQDIGRLRAKKKRGDGQEGSGLKELCITTNGIAMHRKLDAMADAGLTGVNLSLDTLDPHLFQIMTRRRGFEAVVRSIERILEMNRLGAGIKLKINVVVMRGVNEREIVDFVEMGREKDVEVRFIEYMPFEGNKWERGKMMGFQEMKTKIRERFPGLARVSAEGKNDTSKTYQVPGFVGRVGFITSMTHNFCGSCNRLRITSDGNLKVCLFGKSEVSLRDLLRKGNGGRPIDEEAMEAIKRVEMDRRQALPGSTEGLGYGERERELLEVIGMAVKRKKEKHAGMGELENMKNRPMILIAEPISPATQPSKSNSTTRSLHPPNPQHPLRWPHRPSTPLIPTHLLPYSPLTSPAIRLSSTKSTQSPPPTTLPHLTPTSEIHIIPITSKSSTHRTACAIGHVRFSSPATLSLLRSNLLRKGDVLAVARVAGLMAMKRTAEVVPLAHTGVAIMGGRVWCEAVDGVDMERNGEVDVGRGGKNVESSSEKKIGEDDVVQAMRLAERVGDFGGVRIGVLVETEGKTGVEMEALTGVMGAALTVVDMVKSVDKGCEIQGVKVVGKKGGRSGGWGVWADGGGEKKEGKGKG